MFNFLHPSIQKLVMCCIVSGISFHVFLFYTVVSIMFLDFLCGFSNCKLFHEYEKQLFIYVLCGSWLPSQSVIKHHVFFCEACDPKSHSEQVVYSCVFGKCLEEQRSPAPSGCCVRVSPKSVRGSELRHPQWRRVSVRNCILASADFNAYGVFYFYFFHNL